MGSKLFKRVRHFPPYPNFLFHDVISFFFGPKTVIERLMREQLSYSAIPLYRRYCTEQKNTFGFIYGSWSLQVATVGCSCVTGELHSSISFRHIESICYLCNVGVIVLYYRNVTGAISLFLVMISWLLIVLWGLMLNTMKSWSHDQPGSRDSFLTCPNVIIPFFLGEIIHLHIFCCS